MAVAASQHSVSGLLCCDGVKFERVMFYVVSDRVYILSLGLIAENKGRIIVDYFMPFCLKGGKTNTTLDEYATIGQITHCRIDLHIGLFNDEQHNTNTCSQM